jgi:hypothetical protein
VTALALSVGAKKARSCKGKSGAVLWVLKQKNLLRPGMVGIRHAAIYGTNCCAL